MPKTPQLAPIGRDSEPVARAECRDAMDPLPVAMAPDLHEPAPYAEGTENAERVVCRWALTSLFSGLGWSDLPYLVLAVFFAIFLRSSRPWLMAIFLTPAVWGVFSRCRFRVTADAQGLRWRRGLRETRIPWDEVTWYGLTWWTSTRPPLPVGERDLSFGLPLGSSRYFRMPKPEELTAFLSTKKGHIVLGVGLSDREQLCRVVAQRATGASTKHWKCQEYTVPKLGLYPSAAKLMRSTAVLAALAFVNLLLLHWVWTPSGPVFSRLPQFMIAVVLVGSCFQAVKALDRLGELKRREGEKIAVNREGLTWEKGDMNLKIRWVEILEFDRTLVFPFFGGRQVWSVRSTQGEFSFSATELAGGRTLPAIIYSYCPQLWDRAAPIADPGGSPKTGHSGRAETETMR